MPIPPLSEDQLNAAVDAHHKHDTQQAAAESLGLARTTYQSRLKKAGELGLLGTDPVVPGFAIKQISSKTDDGAWIKQTPEHGKVYTVPEGHSVKGESALVDADGRQVLKWLKTRSEPSAVDIAESLKAAFKDWVPAATVSIPPIATDSDLLNLIPCNDWHVGMFAWRKESDVDWDLKIAEEAIGSGVEDAIERSPRAGTAIVLGGGDLTHADNNKNQTARSSNQLDVDGRHQKVVETAGRLMVRTIDAALRRNGKVIVRNLKGNHDEETAPAIAWFLFAWYRNDPRVTIDMDNSLFFYHRHGLTLLAATHGHEAKLKDMPMIMAHRRAEDWGATKHRYAHGFHIHHQSKMATEGGGVIMESHQAPIPQDAWHFGSGFLSGRSLQSITYHARYGEYGRVRVAMIDTHANDNEKLENVA